MYELPPGAIAHLPAEKRTDARLMLVERQGQAEPAHARVSELPTLVRGDELFVFNDTRVVPARLLGRKDTGGAVELLVLNAHDSEADQMLVLARSSKRLRPGQRILIADHALQVLDALGAGRYLLTRPADLLAFLNVHGTLPLPPYVSRPDGPTSDDAVRYQTTFARHPGAVAAPTAGLHFTPALIDAVKARGCRVCYVTLHVGPGTFQPVRTARVADHEMHRELAVVGPEALAELAAAREEGRPVVAVGTTVVRALEGRAAQSYDGALRPGAQETDIFIRPGHTFRVVDQLITNFHLPGSTLLMLVSALASRDTILEAYAIALSQGYRFYSYGDGMWLR